MPEAIKDLLARYRAAAINAYCDTEGEDVNAIEADLLKLCDASVVSAMATDFARSVDASIREDLLRRFGIEAKARAVVIRFDKRAKAFREQEDEGPKKYAELHFCEAIDALRCALDALPKTAERDAANARPKVTRDWIADLLRNDGFAPTGVLVNFCDKLLTANGIEVVE